MAKQRTWKVEFKMSDREHESLELSGAKNKVLERLYKLNMLQKCNYVCIFEADNLSYYGRCIKEKYKELKSKGLDVEEAVGNIGYTVFNGIENKAYMGKCQWYVFFSEYGKEQVMGICSERVKNNLITQMMTEESYKKYNQILIRAITSQEYQEMCEQEMFLFKEQAKKFGDNVKNIEKGVVERKV